MDYKYGIAFGANTPHPSDGSFHTKAEAKAALKVLKADCQDVLDTYNKNGFGAVFDWESYYGGEPHIVEL